MFLKTHKNGASESLKFLCPISFFAWLRGFRQSMGKERITGIEPNHQIAFYVDISTNMNISVYGLCKFPAVTDV